MDKFATELTFLLSCGVVLMQVLFLYLLYRYFSRAGAGFFGRHGIALGLCVSLSATVGSFLYSNVVGFEPCTLCWWQRVFLFPQVLLFALALWKKDSAVFRYSLTLSVVGALIAAYHYYGQMFNTAALPCAAEQGVSPCAVRFFVEFGYITIPMMSLSVFLLLIALTLLGIRRMKGDGSQGV